jgi:hypothetical protein
MNTILVFKGAWSRLKISLLTHLEGSSPAQRFWHLFAAALLLRFCLMPFFCHLDFLSEFKRIHIQYELGNLFPGSRFIVSLVEWINYAWVAPLLPERHSLFFSDPGVSSAGHHDFFLFASDPSAWRALFLLKLGYLFFDLWTGYLIFKTSGADRRALSASALWFFNPVTLFSFYIFGRYESIALAFLVASLAAFRKGRMLQSCLLFGLCLWSREIFILILPFYGTALMLDSRNSAWHKYGGLILLLLILGMVSNYLPHALGFQSVIGKAYGSLAEQNQVRHLIAFAVNWYYPMVIACGLSGFYLITSKTPISDRLENAILFFFLSFFTFCVHSVHYVAWLLPILCLRLPASRSIGIGAIAYCICWIAYWLLATDLGVFTQWLAAPMSTHLLNLPNLPIWLAQVLPNIAQLRVGELSAVFKSLQVACLIFIGFRAWQGNLFPTTQGHSQ